ncbi:uncharacterized protein LOC133901293 isoform X2 [Phragmites australis]|uniref:uncharacterized protein LOC133901293 isoform X2 n=1 Tax=Phragmites australis TaxID=29695 RepID=UPI002D76F9B1|nr:uncharacterized protein LOC133901293 isoform X2 [Phragmites australis]
MAPTLPAKRRRAPSPAPPPPPSPERKTRMTPPSPKAKGAKAKPTPSAKAPTLLAKIRKAPSPERKRRKTKPSTDAKGAEAEPKRQKPMPFQRTWPPNDEVRILEALAAHRRDHGDLPATAVLFAALDGRLDRKRVGVKEVGEKQRSLKRRYDRDARKRAPPADDHEQRLYLLSRDVWGGVSPPKPPIAQAKSVRGNSSPKPSTAQDESAGEQTGKDAAQVKRAGEQTSKDAPAPKAKNLGEMRELYPYLVHESMLLVDPAILERVLPTIDDNEAQALNSNIKKMRKQLTKAITESARMKNMEMPTVCLCPFTKLQPEKLTAENENYLLFKRLDKTNDMDICAEKRLARVEHEIEELRQIVLASKSQAKIENNLRHDNSALKGIRCESAESGLQSIVAENQIPCNMLQKKIEATNSLPNGKNEEVTSKYCCALPRNVPCNNKLQGMILPHKKPFHGRRRKIDAKSQTPHNTDGKEVVLLSIVRPYGPVAKAIIQTSSQSTIVGGIRLGTQCCKVFVTNVLQTEAPLLRQYGNMTKMSHALKCSIAWPREQIRHDTVAGMAAPEQPSHQGH